MSLSPMPEYVIRTAATHEWPPIRQDRLADVLTPAGPPCEGIEGWGDFRLRCGDTEVSFSGEDVGWQVAFDGPMPQAECARLVEIVCQQVSAEAGDACEWLQIA
jgi:hypothetical protein